MTKMLGKMSINVFVDCVLRFFRMKNNLVLPQTIKRIKNYGCKKRFFQHGFQFLLLTNGPWRWQPLTPEQFFMARRNLIKTGWV
jgi:hypothetical protein